MFNVRAFLGQPEKLNQFIRAELDSNQIPYDSDFNFYSFIIGRLYKALERSNLLDVPDILDEGMLHILKGLFARKPLGADIGKSVTIFEFFSGDKGAFIPFFIQNVDKQIFNFIDKEVRYLKRHQEAVSDPTVGGFSEQLYDPWEELEQADLLDDFIKYLDKLDPSYSIILQNVIFEEKSKAEIKRKFKINPSEVDKKIKDIYDLATDFFLNRISHIVISAMNYYDIFNPVWKAFPELKEELLGTGRIDDVKNQVSWAKKNLKKQDRIVWYLNLVRLGLLNFYKPYQPITNKAMQKFIDANPDLKRSNFLVEDAKDAWYGTLKRDLEHFLSLGVHNINTYTFPVNESWTSIKRKFEDWEQQWVEAAKEEIPYEAQPLEGENAVEDLIDFGDGWHWLNLNKAYCDLEGAAMGHCGNAAAREGEVLSLRKLIKRGTDPSTWAWYPAATFIRHNDGHLGEMKGRGNNKPSEKFHKYIKALLELKVGGDYYITDVVGGGYMPQENFSIQDLSEGDQEDLYEDRPELMPLSVYYKKFGVTPELKDKIKMHFYFDDWTEEGNIVLFRKKMTPLEFAIAYGDKTTEDVAEAISKGYLDIDAYAGVDDAAELVNEALLTDYLEKHFPEDQEDWVRSPVLFAWDNIDGFEEAVHAAVSEGYEVGTMAELESSLQLSLSEIKTYLGDTEVESTSLDNISIDGEIYLFDDETVISVTPPEFFEILDIYEDELLEYGDFDFLVTMREPHGGFSEFSFGAAEDRFAEVLREEGLEELT